MHGVHTEGHCEKFAIAQYLAHDGQSTVVKPCSHELVTKLEGVIEKEVGSRHAGTPYFCTYARIDVIESGIMHCLGYLVPPSEIGSSLFEHAAQRHLEFLVYASIRTVGDPQRGPTGQVEIVDLYPPPGSQGARQSGEHCAPLWQVKKYSANMNKVEFRHRQGVMHDVVTLHTDIATGLQAAWLYVGNQDVSTRPHLVSQPPCDTAAAAADLQTLPPLRDVELGEPLDGKGIQQLYQAAMLLLGVGVIVVEHIMVVVVLGPIRSHRV
jgi:hypothetical protein